MTKVLLLGVFPRGVERSNDYVRTHDSARPSDTPGKINDLIAPLDDGKMVKYLDIPASSSTPTAASPRPSCPTSSTSAPKATARWAEAIEPTLWDLMQ